MNAATLPPPPRRNIVCGVDFGARDEISATALARQLAIHLATVHRWCIGGCRGALLRSHRIGARRVIRADDWREFFARTNKN